MRTYFAPVLFILLMAACKDNTTTGIPDKGNNQVTQATEPVIQPCKENPL